LERKGDILDNRWMLNEIFEFLGHARFGGFLCAPGSDTISSEAENREEDRAREARLSAAM
jgi:hypothetical protein